MRPGLQTVQDLQRVLESVGATKVGSCKVDCEPFFPAPNTGLSKTLYLLHSSEYPASSFGIVGDSPGSVPYVVADTALLQLIQKFPEAYQTRTNSKIEFQGLKYAVGDFTVKVGTVSIVASVKGNLVEVEYRACSTPFLCLELMREFCTGLLGQAAVTPAYVVKKFTSPTLPATPVDTMNQYLEHFLIMRKVSSYAVGPPLTTGR